MERHGDKCHMGEMRKKLELLQTADCEWTRYNMQQHHCCQIAKSIAKIVSFCEIFLRMRNAIRSLSQFRKIYVHLFSIFSQQNLSKI